MGEFISVRVGMMYKKVRVFGVKFDIYIDWVGIGFTKFSFKRTSLTFLFDWTLRLGFIAIRKRQTKDFQELKRMSDMDNVYENKG